jgi:CPA1 family monovalent cation:H+ antiporter
MGIWLANVRDLELDDVLNFKESLTLVLVAGLFILLAARLDIMELQRLGWGAIGVLLLLQFIAGPLRALVASLGTSMKMREILFVGWIFPRGIVAAAISALFALRLEKNGFEGAEGLVPLVFTVIIGTVVIQSLTAKPLARLLSVAEPDSNGVLIVGANPVALAIAKALSKLEMNVVVADSHWASIREARMMGIPTFYGSAVSSYAEDKLELTGLGNLLALSRRPGLNELACVRYSGEFGRNHVYTISEQEDGEHEKHKVSGESRGRILFDGEVTLDDLLRRLQAGDELKTTVLTDEFGFSEFSQLYSDVCPLFAINPEGRLRFPVSDQSFQPEVGWTIAALVSPSEP